MHLQRILFVAAVLLYTGYLPSASVLFAQDPARAKVEKYLENFRDGARHEFVMLPLTDGLRLATDIFLPPQGDGPWPVLLFRTPYDRFYPDTAATATRLRAVLVCQSQRGRFESEGTLPRGSFANEINDSHDVVEWCAKQSWCDGRVLMWGASGAGISPANAIWSRSPHLTAVSISDTADDAHRYFRFQQGARRLVYNWFTNRNEKVPVWPRPTTEPYDITARSQFLAERSRDNQTYFLAKAGWYDQFYESALESFAALAPAGRAHLVMHPKGHGAIPLGGKPLATKPLPPELAPPTLETLLYSPEKLPNRYETSTSTTAFRTAHNTIHCEPNRSSKMSLPVVSLP